VARVLVVDDTPQIRLLLRLNLEIEGFDVEESADGATCMRRLRDSSRPRPDVVCLDAVMEPVDGWTVVEQIRGDEALRDLPILMITASVHRDEGRRAARAGVDSFIAKPFDPDAVVAEVARLSSAARAARR
jgi:CheY-like chemotaxis protein